jgi:hypothetical protein
MAPKVKSRSAELAALRKEFAALLEAKERSRTRLAQAKELPHAGRTAFLIDPSCDAPPGKCARCVELPAAVVAHARTVREFNQASQRLTLATAALLSKAGRTSALKKGSASRARTLKIAIEEFGPRSWLRSADLRVRLRLKLPRLAERTIERHLKHPDVIAGLRRAGKKII